MTKLENKKSENLQGKLYSLLQISFQMGRIKQEAEEISLFNCGEVQYGVDEDGYLLDEKGFYLLDSNSQRIQLFSEHF